MYEPKMNLIPYEEDVFYKDLNPIKVNDNEGFTESLEAIQNKTIKKIEYDMTHMGYNTVISSLMILANAYDELESITKEDYRLLQGLLRRACTQDNLADA